MRKVLYILGQLDDHDIDWLASTGYKERFPAKTVLVHEGQRVDYVYLVVDGLLSVTDAEVGGKEIAQLSTGDMVGEISLVDSFPAPSTVTILQNAVLLVIPKTQLLAKLAQDTSFAAHFYRAIAMTLADQLRTAVRRLGYEGDQPMEQETFYQDELDDNLLDSIHLGGDKFDRLLKRLMRV